MVQKVFCLSMKPIKSYKVTVKEVGRMAPLTTEYVGSKDRQEVIEFFGLDKPDVEWYELEEKPCQETNQNVISGETEAIVVCFFVVLQNLYKCVNMFMYSSLSWV